MKLPLKLLRDTKKSIGQFIALVLVVAVGAFFYAGLITYSKEHRAYLENYFEDHNLSDLNVYYDRITKEDITTLHTIDGIKKLEARYTFDATQVFEDHKAVLNIHSIPNNNEINTLTLINGEIPTKKGELFLDSHYAKEHQFVVGDQISLNTNGKDITFTISGLGENVEHVKKNATQDHKSHGIAYIAEVSLSEIKNDIHYNEIMIDAQEGFDIDTLGKSIEVETKHLPYLEQISKERSFGYSQIKQTMYNNNMMSTVVPLVLFLIASIILFLTMSMTIDSQRNQVGIMKALGVKNSSIMLHYMGYPVLIGVIGSFLGCVIADIVFIPVVSESSARSYSLPDITFSLSWFSIIPPLIFSSSFGMLSCYLSGRNILKERAAQAMRPKPPKKIKNLLIERIPGIWSRLSYSNKLILRNIFLNKQKAIASSIGIIGSTVLLIISFGTQAGLQKVVDQIEDVYTYDLRIDYKVGTSADSSQLPAGIVNSYSLSSFPVEFHKEEAKENATLIVTEKDNNLLHFFDEDDNRVSLEDNGVLVPQSYADTFNIAVGDTIQLSFTAPEFKNKSISLKVNKVSAQFSHPSFYITPAYLKSFGIDYSPTSLLVKVSSSADTTNVRNSFEQNKNVDTISDKNDLRQTAEYIMKQNNFAFVFFIICAVVLSFGAIYTISSINIYERNRELATLKVLGYQKSKINRLIFFENIILTTFAVIIALPISGKCYEVIVKAMSSTHQQIPDQLTLYTMVISVILAYLLTLLSNLLLRSKVNKINMIESLKSIE
ncbi:ABC transporter permease [Paenibacillus sp. GSMTC-2017]|uniref:ABC transporter permease n=1 Tax=Paenibacillus sp. GSMTC-2017 TaxID=2794350 RepID=UPI0018D7A568|nr:FtsX-like permease family protein [Paenibacillus sp. GSMTC-2017]MBH5317686.1 ABC transporter permease [Paenibacillus sp. GSMTC-2017]